MKRPKQLPAVDRKSSRCRSVPVGYGVRPQVDWWDVGKGIASTAGGLLSLGKTIWG
jgi:hypothetical protein